VVPAGIPDGKSRDLIGGILDLVRTGKGPETSRKWAASCMLSGECIKVCDYGVNPRFLLAMARLSVAKSDKEPAERRRQGVERYREVSRGVAMLSRLQLDTEVLERLGQKSASVSMPTEPADFVFYTGCNVLKTPHIALLALDIMDKLSISYQVMGGPRHFAAKVRRRRDDRSHGVELDGEAVALQVGTGDHLVSDLLRPVHRKHPANGGTTARLPPVRDESIHAVPRRPAGAIEAVPPAQGRHSRRAA